MIPVQRIGHATYTTPDLARQAAYYSEVVGFAVTEGARNRAILATRLGHEVLIFEPGTEARCTRLSFQVAPEFDLGDAVVHLSTLGIRSERRSNITPGIAAAVVFADPKGTEIE